MSRSLCLLALLLPAWAAAPPERQFENHPAVVLSNDKLELLVLKQGGALASVVLQDDSDKLNPLWNPARYAREAGRQPSSRAGLGHFICVDGFGPVSREEQAAGLSGHGEAHTRFWELKAYGRDGGALTLAFTMDLPVVQEQFTRTLRMVDGENVIYVESELESKLGFDRPVCWAEHATIGSPFLKPGVTVVDMPAHRSRTRPYGSNARGQRYAGGVDFTWPVVTGLDGQPIDLRTAPSAPSGGHTTTLLDPGRRLVFVTALEPERRLILGYLFRQEEFPWLQNWENYPPDGRLARGLEFSTQPFDVPRREAISTGTMFDAPTYRWLPARSRIGAQFLLFYARVPEGMRKVDDVRLEGGKLTIEDRTAGKTLVLSASRPL